jgi:xanthine dehydrogenase YagS FAD-binding subunit
VLGANGERTIPIPGLHRLPGDKPQHDTVLNAGDLITAVELGAPGAALDVSEGPRPGELRFAVLSVAAVMDVENGAVKDVRIALGGVAHVPWRSRKSRGGLRAQRRAPRTSPRRPMRSSRLPIPSGTTPSKCSWRTT